MERYPSGEQWEISHEGQRVVVVEVGGGLRSYDVDGQPVLAGYAAEEQATSGRGQVLMPWPNRIRDGQYTFAGKPRQLALTEPSKHNAIHGLVRWALWSVVEHTASTVTVAYRLHPQQGWVWHLDLTSRYALDAEGLTVTATARNVG
jgi:aldose 1-epimerase